MAPGSSTLGPTGQWGFVYRLRQFTDCVSGLQPPGLAERLAGWGRSCLGSCTCSISELVALSSSLPRCLFSPAGQPFLCIVYTWLHCSCSPEGTPALSIHFEGCEEALSPTRVDLGLLTLSPELIQVLCWDFFPKVLPPSQTSTQKGGEGGGIGMVLLYWNFILFFCCFQHSTRLLL